MSQKQTLQLGTIDLEEVWNTIGLDESETRVRSNGTIVPRRGSDEALAAAIRNQLPSLGMEGACEGPPDLSVGDTIGEGAMGIVKSARQIPVGRDVAVKVVRPEAVKHNAHVELLREAWVTGRLEHPNIVPIYALGRGQDGLPMLVMKRIEGSVWQEVIHDPRHPTIAKSGRAPLDWHLGKLIQVCNAVHFAHSRGIIHRDLKPENVMIGEFGEVYVLDWGIAVSVADDPDLPLAKDVETVAGTPDYMAPEMTTGDGSLLSAATDVFLLGAILHEIVTGETRHKGDTLFDKIYAAAQCGPYDYGDGVPDELAAVLNHAMAFEPADRYQSAAQFRDALASFLSHRSSTQLATEAQARLEAMEYLLESDEELVPEDYAQLNNLFSEARFGFKQALRNWPDNKPASEGLQIALETMADYELRRGAESAAANIIGQLLERRPDLERRLDDLGRRKREQEERIKRLKKIERDVHRSSGTAAAAGLMLLTLLGWGAGYLFTAILLRINAYDVGFVEMNIIGGSVLGVVGVLTLLLRRRLFDNRSSRRLLAAVIALAAAHEAQWLGAWLLDVPFESVPLQALTLTWAILGAAAFAADSRLLIPALTYIATSALTFTQPHWAPWAYGVASLIAAAGVGVAWRPKFAIEDPEALRLEGD